MNKPRGASRTILTVDVGGTHVKVMTNQMRIRRGFASGPDLSPRTLVAKVRDLTSDWSYDVVSLGYPGPVIRNRPFAEPYNLGSGWVGFDFEKAFDRPTQVVNDALMQALGSYVGGRMLFLGLGTGLGSAMIVDGILEPMELGHFHYRKGKTFEHYLGTAGLKRLGKRKWKHRVDDVVKRFVAAFEPDYVVLGVVTRRKSIACRAERDGAAMRMHSRAGSGFGKRERHGGRACIGCARIAGARNS